MLNRTAYEVLQMIKVCRDEKIQTLTVPFLALHGAEDRVTLVKGSHYLMEKSATPAEDKELIVMPGLKHDIFHEKQPDGNECIKTVVNYLDKCFDARENPQPKPQTQAQTTAPADKGDMNGKGEARGGNEEVEEEKETDKKKEKKEVFEM